MFFFFFFLGGGGGLGPRVYCKALGGGVRRDAFVYPDAAREGLQGAHHTGRRVESPPSFSLMERYGELWRAQRKPAEEEEEDEEETAERREHHGAPTRKAQCTLSSFGLGFR